MDLLTVINSHWTQAFKTDDNGFPVLSAIKFRMKSNGVLVSKTLNSFASCICIVCKVRFIIWLYTQLVKFSLILSIGQTATLLYTVLRNMGGMG